MSVVLFYALYFYPKTNLNSNTSSTTKTISGTTTLSANNTNNPITTTSAITMTQLSSIEIAKLANACVAVQLKGTFGSGFFINSEGVLITNSHVIGKSKLTDIDIIDNNFKHFKVEEVIYNNSKSDIAVLKVKDIHSNYIKLGDSNDIQIGENVYSISTLCGYLNSFSSGNIAGFRKLVIRKEGSFDIQITNVFQGGSSGSPILNSCGQVVALVYAKNNNGDNIGFSIGINEIKSVLDELDIAY